MSTLACTEQGSGEPVVFVHGDISDQRMWEGQVDAFASAGYRAIAYSRRHAWPNQALAPGQVDPMLGHVADLEALLLDRGLAPAHLVGNSWGASICLMLAAQRPDLVRTLVVQEPPALGVLVDAPPRPMALLALLARRPRCGMAVVRFGLGTMRPTARALARGDLEKALTRFCTGILGREGVRAVSDARLGQMRDNAGAFQAHLTGELPPPADLVRRIRAPTLLITGERSHPTLRLLTGELHRLLAESEQVEIADAAHFANEDQPAAYNRAALAFLQARSQAGPRLGHVALAASDPDALATFYAGLLGWSIVRRWDNPLAGRLAALSGRPREEDHELALVAKPEAAHVAFRVAHAGDLATVHRRAHEEGIPVVGAFDLGHAHSLILRDPEGNAVELYWATGGDHHDAPRPLEL